MGDCLHLPSATKASIVSLHYSIERLMILNVSAWLLFWQVTDEYII